MFAKVFTGPMKASLHRGDGGIERESDLRMAAPFLHEGEQGAILRAKLSQGVPQRIQLLGVDGAGRLGNIFVFLTKREEDAPQFLPPQLVDARIARQPEKPRLKLGRGLQTVDRPDHFDKDLLGQIFDVIASVGHGVNETRDPVLVGDDDLPLSVLIAFLSPANKVGQRGR
jgi:hypothetical protein